jgi:hypothetical protein
MRWPLVRWLVQFGCRPVPFALTGRRHKICLHASAIIAQLRISLGDLIAPITAVSIISSTTAQKSLSAAATSDTAIAIFAARCAAIRDLGWDDPTESSTCEGIRPAAATQANQQIAADTGVTAWFQLCGNTYIVEAINNTNSAATHPALSATDEIVKIVGLVSLSGESLSGHTLTL